jgi:COP9 signalosome complex subunit 4
MTMVVGRRVLGAYVMALCGGSTISEKDKKISGGDEGGDESKWEEAGKAAFQGEKGEDVRREVVEGVLDAPGMAGWCDEQVS